MPGLRPLVERGHNREGVRALLLVQRHRGVQLMGKPTRDGWRGTYCPCGDTRPFISDEMLENSTIVRKPYPPEWTPCSVRCGQHIPTYLPDAE